MMVAIKLYVLSLSFYYNSVSLLFVRCVSLSFRAHNMKQFSLNRKRRTTRCNSTGNASCCSLWKELAPRCSFFVCPKFDAWDHTLTHFLSHMTLNSCRFHVLVVPLLASASSDWCCDYAKLCVCPMKSAIFLTQADSKQRKRNPVIPISP